MTGLNLESFLHLLRADLGAWATLGAIGLLLVLLTWTSWGSRRTLRKCLVLSLAAHLGLALYGSTLPAFRLLARPGEQDAAKRERIRKIRVTPDAVEASRAGVGKGPGPARRRVAAWDRARDALALADPKVKPPRPDAPTTALALRNEPTVMPNVPSAAPEVDPPAPAAPEARAEPPKPESAPAPDRVMPGDPSEIAAPVARPSEGELAPIARDPGRLRPARGSETALALARAGVIGVPALTAPAETAAIRARPESRPAAPPSSPPTSGPLADASKDVAAPEIAPRMTRSDLGLPETRLRDAVPRPAVAGRRPAPSSEMRPPLSVGATLRNPFAAEPAAPSERPRSLAVSGALGASIPIAAGAPDETAEVVKRPAAIGPAPVLSEAELRSRARAASEPAPVAPPHRAEPAGPIALARVTPSGVPALPEIRGSAGGRPLTDVPEVYRSRLDPNRTVLAQRAGASVASEQAVERALRWLAEHQDDDGRWDGGIARYDDGTPKKGDDDFTVHCPPGETCFGECLYWEADTALTGLALLTYLGSGYTQLDGKYAETVGKGLEFLRLQQQPDGDLRGRSKAVGMYCHAMATIALCEAYALTGDETLRAPVARAIGFLVRSRARDGLSWRYSPGAAIGDTSILGWAVMALKSAKEIGIPIAPAVQAGVLGWLKKVALGDDLGLACYLPGQESTPTMTAEAWVCRQFLGVGGPGKPSREAAAELLAHGPDSGQFNLYYWYYGTLAMYQHGGDDWDRWNLQVREQLVRRQRASGHQAGSWDPDESPYGTRGGRIYCTALATLTLEVYYRFLRLYDAPASRPDAASTPRRSPTPR